MSDQNQSPDFIIAGKAFAYRDYDEKLAKAFNYDYESLELNREKSISESQRRFLETRQARKLFFYGGSSVVLLCLMVTFIPQVYAGFLNIPISIQFMFGGVGIVLFAHALVVGQRYTAELDGDLMARAITIPLIQVGDIRYKILFGEQLWVLTARQYHVISKYTESPDASDGQYFVAYYTPRTKHLLSIEPITLVSDYSKRANDNNQTTEKPPSGWLQNIRWYLMEWLRYLTGRH